MDFLIDQDYLELEETLSFSTQEQLIDKAILLMLYYRDTNEIKDPETILSLLEEDSLGLVKRNINLQKLRRELSVLTKKLH